jgi:hypothetical protein
MHRVVLPTIVKISLLAALANVFGSAQAAASDACPSTGARVFAFSDGRVSLNGKVVPIADLKRTIEQLTPAPTEFCYSRQNPGAEPPPQAMSEMEVVASFQKPISFYIDDTFKQRVKLK